MFFETPVMSTNIEAVVEIARANKVPVAVRECYKRLSQIAELLSYDVLDIVQLETLLVGGVSCARKAVAEAKEVFIAALHQAYSSLNTTINLHIYTSIPNFLIQECFNDFLVSWAHKILQGVLRIKNGYLEVANRPGIGVE